MFSLRCFSLRYRCRYSTIQYRLCKTELEQNRIQKKISGPEKLIADMNAILSKLFRFWKNSLPPPLYCKNVPSNFFDFIKIQPPTAIQNIFCLKTQVVYMWPL